MQYSLPTSYMVLKYGHKNFNLFTGKISILQKNAARIMSFSDFKAHSEPLFKQLKILKFTDNIVLQNCLLVYDFFNGNLPDSFEGIFSRVGDTHSNHTRNAGKGMLSIPRYKGTTYGLKSIKIA